MAAIDDLNSALVSNNITLRKFADKYYIPEINCIMKYEYYYNVLEGIVNDPGYDLQTFLDSL